MRQPEAMASGDPDIDRRGLIREAYRMDLGPAECRTIFLDWALGQDRAGPEEIARLLALHGADHPDHPMTAVLREGLARPGPSRPRRGGRGRAAARDRTASR
jgi:hypothetical protein